MRVLFICGREDSYQRNQVLLRALDRFACVDLIAPRQRPKSLVGTSLALALRAFPNILFRSYDLVFIGFYGHILMLAAGALARLRGRQVLFDVFLSNHETLVEDRGVLEPDSVSARLAVWLDRTSCRLASHLLLDTAEHVDFFVEYLGLPARKFSAIPVGCNEEIFYPRSTESRDSHTLVLFYSSYQPLHGVDIILKAADLVRNEDIRFRLIGDGQAYPGARALAHARQLRRVEFIPPIPLQDLPEEIARADICLGGHFGSSAKAGRVVPGKIYQMLAMERAVIAGDTPANRSLLQHQTSAWLCPAHDPEALAEAILSLHRSPQLRQSLAAAGRETFLQTSSEARIAELLRQAIGQ